MAEVIYASLSLFLALGLHLRKIRPIELRGFSKTLLSEQRS